MDFKKLLTAPLHAGQSVVRDLMDNPDQSSAKEQVLKLLGEQGSADIKKFTPGEPKKEWSLPPLDDALSEEGLARKEAAESAGEEFVPTETDFKDSGPYGYLHKKAIHDALSEYEQELQANRPNIDFEGVLKSRLADLASAPEPKRTNPFYRFAMAMGNPEHARELIAEHNKDEEEANLKQSQRWQELLDMKKQALEGSIKQAMADGDARKVISGKWLETLAQIEQDKAKLTGTMQQIGERNAGAERRAELRGQWALEAVKARANAMLQAVGIRTGSTEYTSMMDNARAMLNTLVRKGETYEDAYDKVEDWMEDQLQGKHPVMTPQGGGAPSPAAGSTPGSSNVPNEMEQEILRGRKK
jgi:hypothetical protein